MLCILCASSTDEQMLDIFDESGQTLNISSIITKHFWLKPNEEDPKAKSICIPCWSSLKVFNDFYESIEEAHIKLSACNEAPEIENDNDQSSNRFNSFSDFLSIVVKEEEHHFNETDKSEIPTVENDEDEEEDEDLSTSPSNQNDNWESDDSVTTDDNSNNSKEDDQEEVSDSGSDYIPPQKMRNPEIKSTYTTGQPRIRITEFDSFIKKHMKLSCSLCAKPAENFQCLKKHFLKVHEVDTFVMCCKKRFTSRPSLVHHLLQHQDPEFLKCKICGRELPNLDVLRYHVKSHTNNTNNTNKKEPIHECRKCKKKFSSKQILEKHLKRHTIISIDQVCDYCGKVLTSIDRLRSHEKNQHGGILADESCLNTHMKNEHSSEEVVYTCQICGKISPTLKRLKNHTVLPENIL